MTHTEWIVSLDDDLKDHDEMFVGNVRDGERLTRCWQCLYWDRETLRHESNDFRDWNEAECKVLAERDGWNQIDRYTEAEDFCSRAERKEE